MINSRWQLLIFSFILSAPIFISIDRYKKINLSRTAENFDYLISMPLSLIFFIGLILYWLVRSIFINKIEIKLTGLSILIFLSSTAWIYSLINSDYLKNNLLILLIFIYISAVIQTYQKINHDLYYKLIKSMMDWSLIFGLCAVIAFYINDRIIILGEIYPSIISIYNFEQYYSLGCVLLYGLYYNKFKDKIVNFIYFILIEVTVLVSSNLTAQVMLIIIPIINILFINKKLKKNEINYYLRFLWIIAIIMIPILFPIISWMVLSYCQDSFTSLESSGIGQRIIIHYKIIENINIENFFTALSMSSSINNLINEPHHQFLNYWYYGGFIQMILTISCYLFMIIKLEEYDFLIYSIFYLLVSTMLEAFTHPYLLIQFFLLVSLAYNLNKKRYISHK